MPVDGEFYSIFPNWNPDEIIFNGNVNKRDVEEKITINGASADYTADYYSTKQNVIYALKMKSADNSQLTAYRYEYRGILGLWITARPLGTAGAGVTVEQVADEEYWKTNAYGDVKRYLPATGGLGIFGKPYVMDNGLYWSCNEADANNAWYVMYTNTIIFNVLYFKTTALSIRCVRD